MRRENSKTGPSTAEEMSTVVSSGWARSSITHDKSREELELEKHDIVVSLVARKPLDGLLAAAFDRNREEAQRRHARRGVDALVQQEDAEGVSQAS